MKTGAKKNGFTLIEVLVCMLIFGFSVSGLLSYLNWGQMHYQVSTDQWRESSSLLALQSLLRKVVTQGVDPQTLPREFYQAAVHNLKIVDLKVSAAPPETYFISVTLYDDRNRNDHLDPAETSIQRMWCYRRRA